MFGVNDRSLKIMYGVGVAVCIIFGLCGIAGGIVVFIVTETVFGVFPLVFGPLMAALLWLVITLRLAEMRDIKFIRNKLYGLDNDGFERFVSDGCVKYDEFSAPRFASDIAAYAERALERLDDRLRGGAVSADTYLHERRRLLANYFVTERAVDGITGDIGKLDADLNAGVMDEASYRSERERLLLDWAAGS